MPRPQSDIDFSKGGAGGKLTKRKAKKKAKMDLVPTIVKPIKEFIKRNPSMFKYMGGHLKK